MNGLHLDLKWSMPNRKYLRGILKTAVSFGIDTILLEFENKIYIDWLKHAIHPDHWKENDLNWFLRLAEEWNLTVIPKVPLLGHMEWVLQWPWWSHLQENNSRQEICPLHPETPKFLHRLLQNVIDLFPNSPIIHIGGDESRALKTCPRCTASRKSKSQLYLNHYLPLIKQVESAGKRAMIYCDMILAHPDIIKDIPRSAIIADWDYWSGADEVHILWGANHEIKNPGQLEDIPQKFKRFKKYFINKNGNFNEFPYASYLKDQGFDVVTFSASRCSGDNYCAPRTTYHIQNAISASRKARELNLMGTLITSWAVRFNHFDTNWPAIFASAKTYQNPKLTIDELSEKFAKEFFRCDWPGIFDDLDYLSPALPHIEVRNMEPYPPDIIHQTVKRAYENPKSKECKQTRKTLPDAKKSYARGLKLLDKHQNKIKRNMRSFDIWMLAAKTLVQKAEETPSLIDRVHGKKIPSAARNRMIKAIRKLQDEHRIIFGKTFLPVSREMEINLRFAESLCFIKEHCYGN